MVLRVDLGNPDYIEGWTSVDIYPHDDVVVKEEAVHWLARHFEQCDEIKAYNLIEHLPNVGMFFLNAHHALKPQGILIVRTDNAEFFPFYIPLIHRLGWAAHCSDEYYPKIMNQTKHYSVFTKLHLQHYAKLYGFKVISIERVTFGARLLAIFRKEG